MIPLTEDIIKKLNAEGVETLYAPNTVTLPEDSILEAPCGLKWMSIERSIRMGAFSYAVSGYFHGVSIGRYVSIGENVQVGRQDHPTHWLGTSPFQYLHDPLFTVGDNFNGAAEYKSFVPHVFEDNIESTVFKPTEIGNDVWIGHGAYIRAGVKVHDGAIIAAHSVVVKDVPPYAVVAGNPAEIKKFRLPSDKFSKLRELQWWNYAPWQLKGMKFNDVDSCIDALHKICETEAPFTPSVVNLKDYQ